MTFKTPHEGSQEGGKPFPRYRVFLVDDDPDDRLFGTKKLLEADTVQEVKSFSDGIELIKFMKSEGFLDHTDSCFTPTIIIIDMNMPKMDGFHVLASLKSDSALSRIPVLVVSSVLNYDTMRKAHDLGADGVFRKPLDMDKFREYFKQDWHWAPKDA